MSDYHRLKTKILDLHDKRYTGSNIHGAHKDNMPARKQLVDIIFKRFDADNNGQIDASELSQVRLFTILSQKYFTQSITGMKLKCDILTLTPAISDLLMILLKMYLDI